MDEKLILLNKIDNNEKKCSVKGCNNKASVDVILNSKKSYAYCDTHLDELKENLENEYNDLKGFVKKDNKLDISTKDALYI